MTSDIFSLKNPSVRIRSLGLDPFGLSAASASVDEFSSLLLEGDQSGNLLLGGDQTGVLLLDGFDLFASRSLRNGSVRIRSK